MKLFLIYYIVLIIFRYFCFEVLIRFTFWRIYKRFRYISHL